jgi:drug/metabolite transporter (DMT)-like permease
MQNMSDTNKSIIFILISSFLFSVMAGLVKIVSTDLPAIEIVFFRNLFGFMIIIYAIYHTPIKKIDEIKNNKDLKKYYLLTFRGIAGFLAVLTYFYLIANIPMSEVSTYRKSTPLLIALFAFIFLQERLKFNVILALFIGFFGIILVIDPSSDFNKFHVIAIFSAIITALSFTSIRELKKYYDTRIIVLSFISFSLAGSLILMFLTSFFALENSEFDWLFSSFVMPDEVTTWIYLFLIGAISTIAQIFLTKAYAITKAGIVGAITYSTIIFSTTIGIFLGDPIPSLVTTLGIGLVLISGLIISFSKNK